MNEKPQNGPGRMPPPVEHRFLKGSSGNKRGSSPQRVGDAHLADKLAYLCR